jgi:hypothetical protein
VRVVAVVPPGDRPARRDGIHALLEDVVAHADGDLGGRRTGISDVVAVILIVNTGERRDCERPEQRRGGEHAGKHSDGGRPHRGYFWE